MIADFHRRILAILAVRGRSGVNGLDYVLQDDGKGVYIARWDEAKLGAAPTEQEIAAAAPYVSPAEQRAGELETAFKGNGAMERLRNATPAQIDAYIDSNVTDLASARAVLKALAKAVAWLARGNES